MPTGVPDETRRVFVTPATGPRPTLAREHPVETGWRVVDLALGGLVPGAVTVVTASDPTLRTAIGAGVARRQSARGTTLVVWAGATSSAHAAFDGPGRRLVVAPDAPAAMRASSAANRAGQRVRLVVAPDADDGGRRGGAALRAWRDLAASLAVPVVLGVSGTAPGWADPGDSHLDFFRTHVGQLTRFVARGSPALDREATRFPVGLDLSSLRVAPITGGSLFRLARRERWAPEPDFDGVLSARPTALTRVVLVARLMDPDWKPADRLEALTTLEALAAAIVTGSMVGPVSHVRALVRLCAGAWGRLDDHAWAIALRAMRGGDLLDPVRRAAAVGLHPSTFHRPDPRGRLPRATAERRWLVGRWGVAGVTRPALGPIAEHLRS